MFERILLPLDGSELAEIAIPYGEELASRLGSEMVLYHVHGYDHKDQEHVFQAYLNRLAEIIRQSIRKNLANDDEIKVSTRMERGDARENICNMVIQNKIDLIIMASVSISGLKIGKVLGSVTDHVCHSVPIPVILIGPKNDSPTNGKQLLISNILIPLDGSWLSKQALPIGEELAGALKARIILFQMARMIYPRVVVNYDGVINYGRFNERQEQITEQPKLDEEEEQNVHGEIIALEAELRERGLNVTHSVISGTDAANEIIEAGKEVGADLFIMSTHDRSGLDRWILPSVTEKVMRYGNTPLLLINAKA